ncbi:MAG: hypothetical protein ABEJ28_03010 [Salinigranum sp.]
MSAAANTVRQPRPGPDWSIQGITEQRDWSDEIGACAYCGAPVDMRGPHYGMALTRTVPPSERGDRKRTLEYERFVFCDRECVAAWKDEE